MSSIADSRADALPAVPDIGRKRMAKVDARIPDMDWNAALGAALQRAVRQVWESNKVAAAVLQVDDAEFGKWLSGTRRAQWDRCFACEALREPLMVQLAKLAGAQVRIQIEFERKVG